MKICRAVKYKDLNKWGLISKKQNLFTNKDKKNRKDKLMITGLMINFGNKIGKNKENKWIKIMSEREIYQRTI